MSKVALLRCNTYDEPMVKETIRKGIQLLGGIEEFVQPGEKILLKPNLLAADPPEKCTTTNPAIFKAVAELLQEAKVNVRYGDSPAFHSPSSAAKKAGLGLVAENLGIPLVDFEHGEDIFYEQGMQNKKFFIAKGVLEADGLISLPKLKTHALARMTGCIKNQFGCIPGPLKGEMHVKLPNPLDFSKMLVDLNHYISPRLYVMDGIMAMEGNGPRSGNPIPMNVILISSDPVALDGTVCRLVDLDPEYVPTTKYGMEVGMGTYLEEEIELVGEDLESFKRASFNVIREPVKGSRPFFGRKLINALLVPKPVINESYCVKCGVCVMMCPVNPKAVDWDKDEADNVNKQIPPVYEYDRCIRCYCCQELCPESAIVLKVPFFRRIIGKKGVNH